MTPHPDLPSLQSFATGGLAPARTAEVDAHVRDCPACRSALAGAATPAASRRVLLRLERESGHLPFETLSALVDGGLDATRRATAERHLAICARCRHEASDLRQAAARLARPLPRAAVAAAPRGEGLFAAAARWLGSTGGIRAVAAGAVVIAVGALVVTNRDAAQNGARGGGGTDISATFHGTPTPSTLSPDAANGPPAVRPGASPIGLAVFDRIDRIAPEASAAWRAGDLAAVARALEVRAVRGDAGAAHALGVLYADGRGVAPDRAKATALLKQAAARKDPGAAADLATLDSAAADGNVR